MAKVATTVMEYEVPATSPDPENVELTALPGGTVKAPVEKPPLAANPGIVLVTASPVSSIEPEFVTVIAPAPAPEPLGTTREA